MEAQHICALDDRSLPFDQVLRASTLAAIFNAAFAKIAAHSDELSEHTSAHAAPLCGDCVAEALARLGAFYLTGWLELHCPEDGAQLDTGNESSEMAEAFALLVCIRAMRDRPTADDFATVAGQWRP